MEQPSNRGLSLAKVASPSVLDRSPRRRAKRRQHRVEPIPWSDDDSGLSLFELKRLKFRPDRQDNTALRVCAPSRLKSASMVREQTHAVLALAPAFHDRCGGHQPLLFGTRGASAWATRLPDQLVQVDLLRRASLMLEPPAN